MNPELRRGVATGQSDMPLSRGQDLELFEVIVGKSAVV